MKPTRPYIRVYVEINGIHFAIPMRSHIQHPYVLWTDKEAGCGLDFSKSVVVAKESYIDGMRKPYIRQNEFDALRGKEYQVKQKLLQFIKVYKKAKKRLDVPRNQRICRYSTLQYFESYLEGIE